MSDEQSVMTAEASTGGLNTSDLRDINTAVKDETTGWWEFMPDIAWMIAAGAGSLLLFFSIKNSFASKS